MTAPSATRDLQKLARYHGVQTAYYTMAHHRRSASSESLLAALQVLGAPVADAGGVPSALREQRQRMWRRAVEPVVTVWDGRQGSIVVRVPADRGEATLLGGLSPEDGESSRLNWRLADYPAEERTDVEGVPHVAKRLPLPSRLQLGYHRLALELPGQSVEALVVAAPRMAHVPVSGASGRTLFWGVFVPLYALHTHRSWGGGDLSDLEALIEWTAGIGGEVVATLPLLPTFLDDSFDPSPYAPVTRLAWNEFYVDVERSPHLDGCHPALDLMKGSAFRRKLDELRKTPLVDYQQEMRLKRQILERLARCCCEEDPAGELQMEGFGLANPTVAEYAGFRAARERTRTSWRSWPQEPREGRLLPGDYDTEVRRYYLYTQWLLHQQVASLTRKASGANVGLYLDYPLGVHPDGFDVWRHKHLFMLEASAGAPPDPVFTSGQNWGFPPFHPEALREDGYRYHIECLRHHMTRAKMLRIDHVMGFHRMFIVPNGGAPGDGVYVRYNSEEFYAILSTESHRTRTLVVGEDLGTVPSYVRPNMRRHGVHRMYVVQYELSSNDPQTITAVPRHSVASINTHDMPPLEGFWQGLDIVDRARAGLTDARSAKQEERDRRAQKANYLTSLEDGFRLKGREESASATVLDGTLELLGASPATAVIVNLEDLWHETEPQNLPGTGPERPNWRRKTRYGLEEFATNESVLAALHRVDSRRRQRRGHATRGL